MARICELCEKGYQKGNLVCFSNKKSIKRSYPNLRSVRVNINGTSQRVRICTSCLGAIKKDMAEAEAVNAVKASLNSN